MPERIRNQPKNLPTEFAGTKFDATAPMIHPTTAKAEEMKIRVLLNLRVFIFKSDAEPADNRKNSKLRLLASNTFI